MTPHGKKAEIEVFIDVTNTLETGGTTGMQRQCRRLIVESYRADTAPNSGPSVGITPIRWCTHCQRHLRLNDAETQLLVTPRPVPTRRLDRLPAALIPAARVVIESTLFRRIRTVLERPTRRRHTDHHDAADHARRSEGVLLAGCWFVDFEAAWWNEPPRKQLLVQLNEAGVNTGVMVADVFPTTNPEWFDRGALERFPDWIDAHLRHAQLVVANSPFSLDQALRRRSSLNPAVVSTKPLTTGVLDLGADYASAPPSDAEASGPANALNAPYVLFVSTIEPRKNHGFLLDVFDHVWLKRPGISLVLVGRQGWNCAEITKRIRRHPEFNHHLHWFESVSDTELGQLYDKALLTACPSLSEGFGLSIIESLHHGIPVIANAAGGQSTVAVGVAQHIRDGTVEQWATAIAAHVESDGTPSEVNREARRNASQFIAPTWHTTAKQFLEFVQRAAIASPTATSTPQE